MDEIKVDSPCPRCQVRGRLILKHLHRSKQELGPPAPPRNWETGKLKIKYSDRPVPFLYCGHCSHGIHGEYLVECGEQFAVFDPPEEMDGK